MVNITKKGNRVMINGHTQPDICAAISTIMYTCYNILVEYDRKGIELKDSLDNGKDYDNVEMILRRNDTNTEKVWYVMCQEFKILSEQYPDSVSYIEE